MLQKPVNPVAIVGYGAYVPRYLACPAAKSARGLTAIPRARCAKKAVPGLDEDTATMSVEAARTGVRRLTRAELPPCGWAAKATLMR